MGCVVYLYLTGFWQAGGAANGRRVTGSGRIGAQQPGHYSSFPAPNFQPIATQERDDQCVNRHYSRELLMMGIAVPATC